MELPGRVLLDDETAWGIGPKEYTGGLFPEGLGGGGGISLVPVGP